MEEQFYLFWAPVLFLLLKFRQRPVPWLCAFIASSWVSLVLTTKHMVDPPNSYYRPDTRMNELFLGCLIVFVMERYQAPFARWRPRLLLGPIALGAIVYIEVYSDTMAAR